MTFSERTGRRPYRYDDGRFVEFGRLSRIGERLVCHLCGRDYLGLQTHVRRIHGLAASEYKEMFGLNRNTPLVAGSVSRRHSEIARKTIVKAHKVGSRERLAELRPLAVAASKDIRMERLLSSPTTCPQGHVWDGWTKRHGDKRQRSCRQCNRAHVKAARLRRRARLTSTTP